MHQFKGKVVWVTGSSKGIGRATALEFAKHGANVIVHCNQNTKDAESLVREIEKVGAESMVVQGDVSDKSQVEKMVEEIIKRFDRIDVLINNAGAMVKRARMEEMDEELWDKVLGVNLKSVFLVTKAVLPVMKKQGRGRIINLTSIAARNGGGVGALAYAAAKGGVSTMTRGLAKDLAEYNILVNAIAPGIIDTPFHDETPTELRQKFLSQIPLRREGTPEEVAGTALFLASDYANYLTGEIIEVNGGQLMD